MRGTKRMSKLTADQKWLRRRILEISHEVHASHLGSCLSAVDAIDVIYRVKKRNERFVLSNGHAGVALYVVLEKHGLFKNPKIEKQVYIHPDRHSKRGIDASTGSLGQGLPIAVGMAISNRKKSVYCMISDGECTEGSVWEAIRVASEQKLSNLKIVLNANGWGAYDPIPLPPLRKRLRAFGCHVVTVDGHDKKVILKALQTKTKDAPLLVFAKTTVEQFSFLRGQDAHYYVMSNEDFDEAMKLL